MPQEVTLPLTRPCTLKVYADLSGRKYRTVCEHVRRKLIPTLDVPGREYLIHHDWVNARLLPKTTIV